MNRQETILKIIGALADPAQSYGLTEDNLNTIMGVIVKSHQYKGSISIHAMYTILQGSHLHQSIKSDISIYDDSVIRSRFIGYIKQIRCFFRDSENIDCGLADAKWMVEQIIGGHSGY